MLVILCCLFSETYSQSRPTNFDFNSAVIQAYDLVTSLRFKEAYAKLSVIKNSQPSNPAPLLVEDYIDFLALMISEDKVLFNKLKANTDIRLKKIEKMGNEGDPFYLYIQSEILLHRAAVDLRFGNYLASLSGCYKSFTLLERNKKKFPGFIPNSKNLGLMKVLIGTIPETYRSGVSYITGIEGSIDKGLMEIESVLKYSQNKTFIFENETRIIYAFVLMHINNESDRAWQIMRNEKIDFKTQPLLSFIYANVAYKNKNNTECINTLQNCTYDSKYFPLPLAQLLLGRAKMNRLDKDARIPLEAFLKQYKGASFIKDANLLLYWYYTIYNDPVKRAFYLSETKNKGTTRSETDQAAVQEIKSIKKIIPELLKSRLLYDGGYNDLALKELEKLKINDKSDPATVLEYLYRKARILQQRGDEFGSITNYLQVIETGRQTQNYYACNSALQIALIYEHNKQWSMARKYFSECLNIEPSAYKTSLHGKAKAGLIRIKSH